MDELGLGGGGGRLRWPDFAVALVVFAFAFLFFQRGNSFPDYYHPDEPGKVRQALDGDFNFNHPLLMLQSSRAILAISGPTPSRIDAVKAGRTTSAFFGAAAAALLALAGAKLGGTGSGAAAGLLVSLNQQFYELSHYMKEDPSLAFAVAAVVLAFACYAGKPSLARFAALCAVCGLAASAKYVGAVTLVFPLVGLVGLRAKVPAAASAVAGLAAFAAVFLAVNFPMFGALGETATNVGQEVDYVVRGNKELTRAVPHGVYGAVFRTSTNPAIWLLLAIFYADLLAGAALRRGGALAVWASRWPGRFAGGIANWSLGIFPIAYAVMLSFSPKTHHRYFLPATGILLLLAALGAFCLRGRVPRAVGMAVLAAALAWSALITREYDAAFSDDPRMDMMAYVREKLPPDAIIAQDNRVGLPSEDDPRFEGSGLSVPQRVVGKMFVADLGPIEKMRAEGIRYVAVSESIFGRFLLKTHKPREGGEGEYARRRDFYTELLERGKIVWSSPSGRLQYLQPDLRIYELPEP